MKLLSKNDLVRESEQERKTVVFAGNGAIKGGWDPLRFVLDQWIKNDKACSDAVKALRCQNSEAFHQLAILSYKFKVSRGEQYLAWQKKHETLAQTETKGLHNLIQGFLDLRSQIANAYIDQTPNLSLRTTPQINALIGNNAAYVTTNWDETLWKDTKIKNLVQLHGRSTFAHSMVYPTELLIEDTPYDLTPFADGLGKISEAFQHRVFETYRAMSISALFDAINTTTTWLKTCEKLVIWGYSLGDYDADINAAIGTYLSSSARELIVINPDAAAFRRAVALTNITSAIHLDPLTGVSTKLHL